MAHDEFEHSVQGRFQGFESTPPEAVWTSINSARNRRKKRMLILWWILPLTTAACLGMGIYLGLGSSDTPNIQSTATKTATKSQLNTNKQGGSRDNSAIDSRLDDNSSGASIQTEKTASAPGYTQFSKNGSDGNASETTTVRKTPKVKEATKNRAPKLTPSPDRALSDAPDLISRPLQPIGVNTASLDLCQAYGNGEYLNYNSHAFGIRAGGFVSFGQQKADISSFTNTDPAPTATPLGYGTYSRLLEIAPYYEFTKTTSRFRFQAFALYAASNVNLAYYSGKRQSIGLGSGASYALLKRRFSVHFYVNLQSELGFNRFGIISETESSLSGGGTTTNANGVAPSAYRQFLLAGEAGIRCSYVLNRSRWSINASAGYRNYFWQQQVESQALVRTPNLLHWNAGIRFTL